MRPRHDTLEQKMMQYLRAGFSDVVSWYKIVQRLPVKCTLEEWADWKQNVDAHLVTEMGMIVAQTHWNRLMVSTAFRGMASNGEDNPALFETMILCDDMSSLGRWEHSDWLSSLHFHGRVVMNVFSRLKPELIPLGTIQLPTLVPQLKAI